MGFGGTKHHVGEAALGLFCAAVLLLTLGLMVASCGGTSTTTLSSVTTTAAPTTTAGPATTSGGPSTTAVSTTSSSGGAAGGATVSIKNFAFNPASLTVKVGDTVTWTNDDGTTHTVTADAGAFSSNNLAPGDKFTFTFSTAGTFAYHCSIHPNMKATITVQ